MKILLLIVFSSLGIFAEAVAQQQETKATSNKLSKFGISAGPAFVKFGTRAYLLSTSYHVGVYKVFPKNKLDLIVAVQYSPMYVSFSDGNWDGGLAKFENHVLYFIALARVPFAFQKRLTLDLGPSLAQGLVHRHSNYTTPVAGDYCGPSGRPVNIKTQMLFSLGSSWKLTANNTVSVSSLLAPYKSSAKHPERASYITAQAAFSHTF